jgi:adenylate cyclase
MFVDMRGFSTVTEGMPPDRVVHLVNTYLSAVAETLVDGGATIDKFIGDAVMAFWNAPIAQEDHAAAALRAIAEVERAAAGDSQAGGGGPAARAGRHRAQHRQGLCGADGVTRPAELYLRRRRGDAGRTAGGADAQLWRVELRRARGGGGLPPGAPGHRAGPDRGQGVSAAPWMSSVVVPADAEGLADFAEALGAARAAYLGRDWDAAEAGFTALAGQAPEFCETSVVARLYLDRIATHRDAPPGPDWDGAAVALSKR